MTRPRLYSLEVTIRHCRCVHSYLRVIPTHARQLSALPACSPRPRIVSDVPLKRPSSTCIGHCVASLNTARDQPLKGVQSRCPRGPAKVTFRCSALRLAQYLYTHKRCLLLPTVARLKPGLLLFGTPGPESELLTTTRHSHCARSRPFFLMR